MNSRGGDISSLFDNSNPNPYSNPNPNPNPNPNLVRLIYAIDFQVPQRPFLSSVQIELNLYTW